MLLFSQSWSFNGQAVRLLTDRGQWVEIFLSALEFFFFSLETLYVHPLHEKSGNSGWTSNASQCIPTDFFFLISGLSPEAVAYVKILPILPFTIGEKL